MFVYPERRSFHSFAIRGRREERRRVSRRRRRRRLTRRRGRSIDVARFKLASYSTRRDTRERGRGSTRARLSSLFRFDESPSRGTCRVHFSISRRRRE